MDLTCSESLPSTPGTPDAPKPEVHASAITPSTPCSWPGVINDAICQDVITDARACARHAKTRAESQPLAQRAAIVAWMGAVQTALGMSLSTLFLSIELVDQVATWLLSPRAARGRDAKVVVTACMAVASKFNDARSAQPRAASYVELLNKGRRPGERETPWGRTELELAEVEVLTALGWTIRTPTVYTFLEQLVGCLCIRFALPANTGFYLARNAFALAKSIAAHDAFPHMDRCAAALACMAVAESAMGLPALVGSRYPPGMVAGNVLAAAGVNVERFLAEIRFREALEFVQAFAESGKVEK